MSATRRPTPMRVFMNAAAMIALAAPATAQQLTPRDLDTLPSRAPQLVASYGADSLQFGELRLPAGRGPFPLAIVIHGGCWTKGFATLKSTAAMASALLDDGIATWNVEYRQVGHPGGGWPNTFRDVGAAIDYVRTLALQNPIDLRRVVLIGHSSGAHLALWASGRPRLASGSSIRAPNPLTVRATVAIDGPGDLGSFIGRDARICGTSVVAGLMGGTPADVPERFHDASPQTMLPLGPSQFLVSAVLFTRADAEAYETAARAAGDSVSVLFLTNGGHFDVIAPGTSSWPQVRGFIRQAFGFPPQ